MRRSGSSRSISEYSHRGAETRRDLSDLFCRFERMFDSEFAAASDVELVAAIEDGVRQEAIAGARRLAAIAELTRRRIEDDDERALWAFDAWACAAAEVGAAMAVGSRRASGQMRIAEALREHLPQVAALFGKGALSIRLVSTITWATRLVQGEQAWADIDAAIAERAVKWERLSEDKLRVAVEAQVARFDPDAQRRTETAVRGRDFIIGACDDDAETVSVFGQLLAPAAAVWRERVAAMVGGLCADDPRSAGERRSDAAGAIAENNDVLACRCGSPDCPSAGVTPKSNVVIRMIADQTAITDATAQQPAAPQNSPPPPNPPPRPRSARLRRRCCWDTACCPTRCWPRRSATGRPSSRSAPPASSPSRGIGPATSWPSSSGCAICSAASPAATSPPIAATSTTPARGPAAPPMRRT